MPVDEQLLRRWVGCRIGCLHVSLFTVACRGVIVPAAALDTSIFDALVGDRATWNER